MRSDGMRSLCYFATVSLSIKAIIYLVAGSACVYPIINVTHMFTKGLLMSTVSPSSTQK